MGLKLQNNSDFNHDSIYFNFCFVSWLFLQSITLHDAKIACYQDLGSQFFLREDDVREKKNR